MKYFVGMVLFCLLVGCASPPVAPPPVTPIVSACPQPPEIAKPILPLQALNPDDLKNLPPGEAHKKAIAIYTQSLMDLMKFNNYLMDIINGYRTNKPL